jgi:hypothetical protein
MSTQLPTATLKDFKISLIIFIFNFYLVTPSNTLTIVLLFATVVNTGPPESPWQDPAPENLFSFYFLLPFKFPLPFTFAAVSFILFLYFFSVFFACFLSFFSSFVSFVFSFLFLSSFPPFFFA